MAKLIYFVGKPYPKAFDLDVFKRSGYKFGVILDKNVNLKDRDRYHNVVEADFSSEGALLADLADHNLEADGLICTYENYVLAKSQIAAALRLPAPSIHSAEISTDKYLMRQAFLNADPSITPGFGLAESEDEVRAIARKLSYPLMIKPTNLVKSLLVLKCDDETELLRNFRYAKGAIDDLYAKYKVYGRRPQLIIEEYFDGKTCSVASFVDQVGQPHFYDGIVSLVNAQDLNIADNYIYERLLPGEFNGSLRSRLFEVARSGIKALEMSSTAAHVEIIYNDKDVKLIEIGARIGGYRPRMYSIS